MSSYADDKSDDNNTNDSCETLLERGFVIAFIVLKSIGFVLFVACGIYNLKGHFRIMQGIMKKIVLYYFWTKLTFIILLIVFVVLED